MSAYADEKLLKDGGWRIHHKDGKNKFWTSPHDGKVYSTEHAIIAHQFNVDQAELAAGAERSAQLERWAKEIEEFSIYETDFDELVPPPDEKPKKAARPGKRGKKISHKSKVLKELGF